MINVQERSRGEAEIIIAVECLQSISPKATLIICSGFKSYSLFPNKREFNPIIAVSLKARHEILWWSSLWHLVRNETQYGTPSFLKEL